MNLDNPFFYLVSGTLLLLVAIITSFKPNKGDKLANVFLAAYFWGFGLSIVLAMAVVFGYANQYPHLYRLAYIPACFIMPGSFLYLHRKLYRKKLSLYDLLHLLPLVIFLFDYFPFFMLSAQEKLAIYVQEANDATRLKLAYAEGWFMPDFGHIAIRYTLFFCYWLAQVYTLWRAHRNPNHPLLYQSNVQHQWLQLFVGSQLLAFLPPALAWFVGGGIGVSSWINVAALVASLVQVYYLIFHPEVLYSLDTALVAAPAMANASATVQASPATIHSQLLQNEIHPATEVAATRPLLPPTAETLDAVQAIVESTMLATKPFTKARYGIKDLSTDTGVPVYKLTQLFNQRYKVNFYGYINRFRIELCLQKLNAKEHEHKTLEALAFESGFQSRATFVRAFKLVTGFTPSEYIAQQG